MRRFGRSHEPEDHEAAAAPAMASQVEDAAAQAAPRRRLRRTRRSEPEPGTGATESRFGLQSEVLLLREENARLKAAQHQGPDIARLLGRARSLPAVDVDRESVADETTRVLVEGLVIRESLLEICHGIERAMYSFKAKLNALESAAAAAGSAPAVEQDAGGFDVNHTNGHGASVA
jgi:hypothetical protein